MKTERYDKQMEKIRTECFIKIELECERLGGKEKASLRLKKHKSYFSHLLGENRRGMWSNKLLVKRLEQLEGLK